MTGVLSCFCEMPEGHFELFFKSKKPRPKHMKMHIVIILDCTHLFGTGE